MTIDGNILTADDGRALKRTDDTATRTTITRVALSPSDSAANWTDCDYGDDEPIRYSTLSIKRALAAIGKWDAAKTMMETSGVWDDFVLANYLSSTDPVFVAACDGIVSSGLLTRAELDAMLADCVWTE